MPNKDTAKESWWERIRDVMKSNISLIVIIAAALLLELTTGVLYYAAQDIIQDMVNQMMEREMNSLYHRIGNQVAQVEVTVENAAWVVGDNLENPDGVFAITQRLVEQNSFITGGAVTFVPNYYPQKGQWFEPYAARREDGTIESMQLGSAQHDYTKMEFFTEPIAKKKGHWSDPYLDNKGAKMVVTTYSVPIYDNKDSIVAVIEADISLDWLDSVLNLGGKHYKTQRFLVTDNLMLLAGQEGPLYKLVLEHLKTDADREGYVTLTGEDGDTQHVFFHPIGAKTDWILVNVFDYDEIYGKLRRIRFSLLLPVMIGLFFAGFIVYRSSRNLERLRKVNDEKERIGGELRVASKIQQSMLPQSQQHQDDVDVCGSLVPAREVGGDLFDYYIRDEKLFFCIGDVSGKGAPSAMVMAVIHSLFRAFSAHENNPARIMQTMNEASCRGNDSNIFVTFFLGILDLPTGRLRYCDAGHDAPIILNAGLSTLNSNPHLPLGVFEDVKYETQEILLQPGSTIFLYTDGVTEAKKGPRQMFGLKRTEEVLSRCAAEQLKPQQILETVNNAVHQFVGTAEQSDDLTMLVIRYTPKEFESRLTESIILKNNIQEVKRFSSFMKSATEKLGIEKSLASQLRLAVEEAVVNAIDYAYAKDTEGDIEVRMMSDGNSLKMMIIDSGVPFDPTAKEMTDTTLTAEDRQIGGLGILLVRELMDSINYEREDGKNILTLIKNLKS